MDAAMATITLFTVVLMHMHLGLNLGNAQATPKFTALLIFGDSTVDTGNNNFIPTIFKANHPPYGQEFPGHIATGRFSNGILVPDILASLLGIKDFVPPFLDPSLSDQDLLTGVNFASAGSGYDDLTTVASGVIPVSAQAGHLRAYIGRLKGVVGKEKAASIIGGSLVVLSAGPNDFIFNFYDLPTRRLQFDVNGYQDFLQNRIQTFVKELYELGCRTMVVSGLPPMGCLPVQMAAALHPQGCLLNQNRDAKSYNRKLSKLLLQLQASLPGAKILYADVYTPLMDIINNPQKHGFVETRRGCCGSGSVEAGPLCTAVTPLCTNPSQYMFWDSIHPTQATYQYVSLYLVKELLPKFSNITTSKLALD